ncbi:hypothetical protein V8G54_024082 [Vigna mungo]|uniref:Uncharacterized protein n=1 Tax=Vigna mungo TaxID=3915 RepID=A0AAQ3N6M5_VIGMU
MLTSNYKLDLFANCSSQCKCVSSFFKYPVLQVSASSSNRLVQVTLPSPIYRVKFLTAGSRLLQQLRPVPGLFGSRSASFANFSTHHSLSLVTLRCSCIYVGSFFSMFQVTQLL